jgi:hypothetical protein
MTPEADLLSRVHLPQAHTAAVRLVFTLGLPADVPFSAARRKALVFR